MPKVMCCISYYATIVLIIIYQYTTCIATSKLLLSFNQFSGKIPSTLQGCRNLEELSLFSNQLTGSIPLEIGNLTMLKALYLSQNKLEGELPPGLGNLKLEVISMRSCNLSGGIPHTIFNMSSLGLLDLAKNRFYGQIPPTLGIGLQNLEGIFLSENSLTGTIPSLANASTLIQIFMFENLFHGPIPTTLGNLRLLKIINLGGNNLTGDAPNQELRFLSSLTNCRYIVAAEFSQNPLNGILPSSIGNFSDSLTYLTTFTSKLKREIPLEIANLRSLDGIYFDSNGLTGHIPWEMGNMKQLERVYLNHNRLEGQIPASLCQLNNLGDLFLSDNLLFGPILTCLAEIKSLRRIYIDSNKFNSSVPNNLWSLSDLVGLNLSSNLLTGSLPDSLKKLEHINELGLSHNQFFGNISSSIGSFQSLTYLSLSHNNFQGFIPQSLKKLLSLEFLDLSFNNLSGRIPKSLEELNFLYYFNVSFNRLEGEIPTGGQFYNFTYMSYLHNDALCGEVLQVPRCKTRSHHRSLLKYILLSLLSSVILVSLAVFLFLKTRKRNTTMLQVPYQLRSTWKEISYLELLRATDTFSDANLLGRGSFGTIYKGRLSDGQDVAVKVFHLEYEGGIGSFFAECEVLRNIRHRNLVKVIICCTNEDFKALVLEFMPNESLDKWLHFPNRFLNMNQRLSIALDVSEALEYIHHDHISPIIHLDIKPSNIVLDEYMVAHVCDFGIVKLFAEGESIARTETLATIGYIAPEYATDGIVSTSGDVYSYGTILVEMFIGKKPTDEMFGEEMSMFDWVSSAHGDAILNLIDIKLFEEENINGFPAKKQSLTLTFELAKDCMRRKPKEKIKMREVVARLEKIKLISEAI